jgi:hypothetical protein
MRALADCAVGGSGQQMPFTAPATEGLGLFILVTGSPESAAVAEARRQISPNDVLIVIAATSMSGGARFVIDSTDDARFVHSWVAVTGGRLASDGRIGADGRVAS